MSWGSEYREWVTVQVSVQGQEMWSVRAAERRVVNIFRQRWRHPRQRSALGEAVQWRLLFVSGTAVLKPNLYDSPTESCHFCQLLQRLGVRVIILGKLCLHDL